MDVYTKDVYSRRMPLYFEIAYFLYKSKFLDKLKTKSNN